MRLMIRILFAFIILILLIGGFILHRVKIQALPILEGEIILSELEHPVIVWRDDFGVPVLSAKSDKDLYYAVGYVMASDRLWQMDLLRRVTQGRLSEIFGENLANTDLLMRSLRMTEKSNKILAGIVDSEIECALESYSAGVNRYIEDYRKKLPPEFVVLGYEPEKWEPVHSVNLIGYMAWDLTMPYSSEIILHKIRQKLGNEYFNELVPDIAIQFSSVHESFKDFSSMESFDILFESDENIRDLGLEVFLGSNNWAASPEKTESGSPLFANDMHLGLSSPGIWYPMHHHVENSLHVTGVVLPGQPFVIAGHNEHIAWGMTNVMVDDMDFYLEKTSEDKPGHYEYMGEWLEFEEKTEQIFIKGGQSVEKTIYFTHRGPVISRFKKTGQDVVSMKWLGNEISHELEAVYGLNRAQNWQDFRKAVKGFVAVSQNIAYADVYGNIGLQTCAGVPVRKKGNGLNVHPGWTDEYDWTGIVPFEELPYSFNPPSGTVSSANNKTADNRYPYHISYWYAMHYRINRIREMLNQNESLTTLDFMSMHIDYQSHLVQDLLPDILAVLHSNRNNLTENEYKTLNLLRAWPGIMTADIAAPAVFDQFYVSFAKNVFLDEMGDSLYTEYTKSSYLARYAIDKLWFSDKSLWADNITTENKEETRDDIIFQSFRDAVGFLENKLGKDPERWQWGNLHTLTLKHPLGSVKLLDRILKLNSSPYPVPGSFHTVSPYAYSLANPYDVNHGASHRHIYDLSDWDKSYVILPTGTSGNPSSPFYLDQTEMYLKGKYRKDYFSINKVKENAVYTLILNSEF